MNLNTIVAKKLNISHAVGNTFDLTLEFFQDNAETQPLNVSGFTFEMLVKDCHGNNVLSFTEGNGITRPANNSLRFRKEAEQMNFDAGGYTYFVRRKDSETVTFYYGAFELKSLS